MDEYPVGTDARLTGIEKLDERQTLGGMDRVRISAHDKGRMPAQFQGYSFQLGGCTPGQHFANRS